MSSVCGGGGKVGDVKLSTLRHFRVFLTAGAMATRSRQSLGRHRCDRLVPVIQKLRAEYPDLVKGIEKEITVAIVSTAIS